MHGARRPGGQLAQAAAEKGREREGGGTQRQPHLRSILVLLAGGVAAQLAVDVGELMAGRGRGAGRAAGKEAAGAAV